MTKELHIYKNFKLVALQDITGWSIEEIQAMIGLQYEFYGRMCKIIDPISGHEIDFAGEVI